MSQEQYNQVPADWTPVPLGWDKVDTSTGIPKPGNIRCCLCGQVYPEDEQCGCGKRVTKDVTIPRSKLREWRRGLLVAGDNCTTCGTNGLGQHHACEILEEIEGYLNGG